jgi:hypothetical protein
VFRVSDVEYEVVSTEPSAFRKPALVPLGVMKPVAVM